MVDFKIDKNFTKQNWRNFENLTGLLFELEFNLKKDQIVITQMAKDGGRDVEIEMSPYSKILKYPKIEIWVEAKLRGKANVNIGDIAGSVIMASNSNINTVYFVTNCFFTPQTIQELLLFGYKSGLQVCLVNGYHYNNLIEGHLETITKRIRLNKETKNSQEKFIEFIHKLKSSLPVKPDQKQLSLEFIIEKGRIIPDSKYNELFKEEQKLELRKINVTSRTDTQKVTNLTEIKITPYIDDIIIKDDIKYQLAGRKRNDLLEEVIASLKRNEAAILEGNSGQGKTFFANHIMRRFYQCDYYVLSTDVFENNTISFTKEVISNLIGLDYFKLLEDDQAIINSLSEYLGIDKTIGEKILEIMRKDRFTEIISSELCLEILIKLIENHNSRKKLLLIVDNLHKASNDLIAFLKNLFTRLSKAHIPVLGLVTGEINSKYVPENHWLPYLESFINGNNFTSFTIAPLDDNDIEDFVKALLPGANINLIRLITTNTLKDPFFIGIYISLLKQRNIIKSKDESYWWLEVTEPLLDSTILRSNQIDSLIKELLRSRLSSKTHKEVATTLYFFNNNATIKELEAIIGEIDPTEIADSGLFQISFQDAKLSISFIHDLYFQNFPDLFSHNELLITASIMLQKDIVLERNDVLGKLYEYIGNFQEAQKAYLFFARKQYMVAPLKSLFYFEKAIHLLLNATRPFETGTYSPTGLVDLIFDILKLYKKYNFLSSRIAPNLFLLLQKHKDFKQLNLEQILNYYYYLGMKFTQEENFDLAKKHFTEAYDILQTMENVSQDIIDKIVPRVGINLKHLGERKQSLDFFELAVQKWKGEEIQMEQYSNLAAYYLTSTPKRSLKYYTKMVKEFPGNESIHLLVDFAMTYFYIGTLNKAEDYLHRALPIAKKRINLAEEARAENILGIINWRNNLTDIAESYFDVALSNGELANNHRWIWRIRTNLAQVAFQNGNLDKAYNSCWAVANHLLQTKNSLILEASNPAISSRRFAAIKAVAFLFYQMNRQDDLKELEKKFSFGMLSNFVNKMATSGNIAFDDIDTNLFDGYYCILG